MCDKNLFQYESTGEAFSSQETYDFQVLGNETWIIPGYKAIKISIFHQLAVKLWLREDDDLQKKIL